MSDHWSLAYDGVDAEDEGVRETLCTLGNGYFATRGAWPEQSADTVHYPGTYLAGVYNRLSTTVAGQTVESEDLVNAPNWLVLDIHAEDGQRLSLYDSDVLSYRQELDLRRGLLVRRAETRDRHGRETLVTQRRFVHMGDMHLAGLQTTIVAKNWSGRLVVRSGIDGGVRNAGVPRYGALSNQHLRVVSTGGDGDVVALLVETTQSKVRIAEAARTTVHHDGATDGVVRQRVDVGQLAAHELSLDVTEGVAVTVEKIVAIHTSRDHGGSEPLTDACERVDRAGRFEVLLEQHVIAWRHLWRRFDVDVTADERVQVAVRLDVFHLLQTISPNTVDLDVGVPARGLHGEAYRGHVFWDELFVFPLLTLRMSVLTRASLLYRSRRLDAARWAASASGLPGAMYPWQSGSSGREESQRLHLNPQSGHWTRDNSWLQKHVGVAVAWNVWQYYEVTGDLQFLRYYGAPMLIEIARFLAGLSSYNRALDRYEILGVMGPDEYHDAYPGSETPGIDNNAYMNVMTVWVLLRALELVELLAPDEREELEQELHLTSEEFDRWDDISHKMVVPMHDDEDGSVVISQFQGYGELLELDWAGYRQRYPDIARLDRILEAEGDTPNRYKLSKQADVLMLLYLLSAEDLGSILERLGCAVDAGLLPRTVSYYLARTAHGSTLSSVVHSWVLARSDRKRSWEFLLRAAEGDLADVQHGSTREGVHLGAMAATIDLLQRCYCGIEIGGGVLRFDPRLPDGLDEMVFHLHYRGHRLRVAVSHSTLMLTSVHAAVGPITVAVHDEVHELERGGTVQISL